MSSNNNDNSGAAVGIAFVVAGFIAMAMMIFAVLAFASLVLTVMALIAWDEPLSIGKMHIEPKEARAFVYRGLAGAVLLPVFVVFCDVMFGLRSMEGYWGYIILAGYAGGSLGIEILIAQAKDEAAPSMSLVPPQPPVALQPPPRALPRQPQEPFRYASWDDEEENRR